MPSARALFVIATVGVVMIALHGIFVRPPSILIVAVIFVSYAALFMCGVLFLRLRVFVDATIAGPRGSKGVVLTFDDGPDAEWTPKVLDALDKTGAKATFFVIGRKAEKNPSVIKDIVARGHIIGLHSYAHDRLFAMRGPKRWRTDLARGIKVLEKITGERPQLFRPPIGHTNPHAGRVARELGLRIIGWNVSARDGVAARSDDVVRRVLDDVGDGAIILLHDAAERRDHEPAAVTALPPILEGLRERGLEIVPLSRFLIA